MSTLAEAKAELGHVLALIDAHTDDCVQCGNATRNPSLRCDERKAMEADVQRRRAEIASWFDAPPDSATLFDLPVTAGVTSAVTAGCHGPDMAADLGTAPAISPGPLAGVTTRPTT